MEKLLRYFIEETNNKFADVGQDVKDIKESLNDLHKFKIEMLASARTTAFIISLACGLVSFVISAVIAIYVGHR